MRKPCINCPFRKDCPPGWLGKKRAEQITVASTADTTFVCHKTIDYSEDLEGDTSNARICAGSVLLHVKEGHPNRLYRLVEGQFTGGNRVFDSVEEMVKHHT